MVRKNIKYFFDKEDSTLSENIDSCISNVMHFLKVNDLSFLNIAFMTVFLRTTENDYHLQENIITEKLKNYGIDFPYCLVAQTPFLKNVGIELIIIEGDFKLIHSSIVSKIFEFDNYLECYARALKSGTSFKENSNDASNQIKETLKCYGFNLNDIIRQWNYMENITGFEEIQDKTFQNYQTFNDIRSEFYSTDNWENGYPSATGIGVKTGGVCISLIANKGNVSFSIKNPVQKNAHEYTRKVLVTSITHDLKSTPKFERGRIVFNNDSFELYVSGTAAIRGEETVEKDIGNQTRITLDNIKKLIESDNILSQIPEIFHSRISKISSRQLSYLRAYVKYENDILIVKKICEEYFGDVPAIYLVADICRENLLVEIEAAILN